MNAPDLKALIASVRAVNADTLRRLENLTSRRTERK